MARRPALNPCHWYRALCRTCGVLNVALATKHVQGEPFACPSCAQWKVTLHPTGEGKTMMALPHFQAVQSECSALDLARLLGMNVELGVAI